MDRIPAAQHLDSKMFLRTRPLELVLSLLAITAATGCPAEEEDEGDTFPAYGSDGSVSDPSAGDADDGPGPSDDGPFPSDDDDTAEPCTADNVSAGSPAECCSGELDDFGNCCSGSGCCNAGNHSHATEDGYCACDPGYEWINDDPYDLTCVGGDDPSDPSDPGGDDPHSVTCGAYGLERPMWCECTPDDDNTGEVVIDGGCSPDPSFAPMQCCAESGYPDTGSCACYLSQSWECMGFGDSCSCSYYWDADAWEYHTTICDAAPEADGTPWRCCASDGGGGCNCEANGAACGANETEVADCASDTALGLTPFQGCGVGETAVTNCEGGGAGGGQCESSYDCPGECYGDSVVCCPTCDDGNCGVYCCDAYGNCY